MDGVHPDLRDLGQNPARDGLYKAVANAINMASVLAFLIAIPVIVALWRWAV